MFDTTSNIIRAVELKRGAPTLLRRFRGTALENEREAHGATLASGEDGSPTGSAEPCGVQPVAADPDEEGRVGPVDEYERGRQDGYREGIEAGIQAGVTRAATASGVDASQARRLVDALEGALAGVEAHQKRVWTEARAEAVQLAFSITRRLLLNQATWGDGVLVDVMDELLRHEESPVLLEIRVAPQFQADVEAQLERLHKYAAKDTPLRVLADPELSGGFVLLTDRGGIDARLKTQVAIVERRLEEVLQVD